MAADIIHSLLKLETNTAEYGFLRSIEFGFCQVIEKGNKMESCWEMLSCGREAGGAKVAELGECVASKEGLGHSCWAIAGTLCGGAVQGSIKEKHGNCLICSVHDAYNRMTGTVGQEVAARYPDEDKRYRAMVLHR